MLLCSIKKLFMIDYNRDYWTSMAEVATENKLRDPEEIKLYEELNLALELDENEDYHVVGSGIGDGIYFHITTQYPNGLPDNISTMFFNVNTDFSLNVQETSQCASEGERMYEIKLKLN